MQHLSNAQEWIDRSLYPFEDQYIQLESGTIHYVDEGQGPVILFVHGTPTWSFLYRGFIKTLSRDYRCIAIDHLGFGLSDKSKAFEGAPQAHAKNLVAFIKKLDLKDITLVVHDFGGPIGLATALQVSDRIQNIVLFNSWLWETDTNKEMMKVDKIIHSYLGRFMYLNLNFSPKVLLKKAFFNKKLLTKAVHQHYLKPFPNKDSRYGLLRIAESLVGSSDWYEAQWQQLVKLEDKNWLILWGTKDPFFNDEYLDRWKDRLPQATIQTFDSGHFVQEEKPDEALKAIKEFLGIPVEARY